MDKAQGDLKLNYSTAMVVSDGNVVMISDQGVPSLLFFQARDQHDGHMHADVVAAVRLNSVDDLKNLAKSINDTIKRSEDREP